MLMSFSACDMSFGDVSSGFLITQDMRFGFVMIDSERGGDFIFYIFFTTC